jgi:hypothetical protein
VKSTFAFTLIDAARRGVILAKVRNYGQIRWHSQSKNKKQRLNQNQEDRVLHIHLCSFIRFKVRTACGRNATAFMLGFDWQFFLSNHRSLPLRINRIDPTSSPSPEPLHSHSCLSCFQEKLVGGDGRG